MYYIGGLPIFFLCALALAAPPEEPDVRKLGRSIGVLEDVTTYAVRGSSLDEVALALRLIRISDSAFHQGSAFHEAELTDTVSITVVRPLMVPTGVVTKVGESYYGGGIFGPVWGYFDACQVGDEVHVRDIVRGSPIFRVGHHNFTDGIRALRAGIARARACTRALERAVQ